MPAQIQLFQKHGVVTAMEMTVSS